MSNKTATTTEPIADLLAERWSPRAFEAGRQVPREMIVSLFEAARWAPSCFNEQPWRYLICDRFDNAEAWEKALHCLVEGNRAWAQEAPVLMAAIADTKFTRNDKPNRWCEYDTGAASENMCVQATELGLAIHQMGGFDAAAVTASFHVPDRYTPMAMIALGFPGDPQTLNDKYREIELGERTRRPIGDFVFANDWQGSF